MKPNPDIALIYHYDLARALAGEVVDWQAIPVNVQAGREGGDLCRAAADFGKRRDLFAMPAPHQNAAPASVPAGVVEQCAVDPQPDTASPPVAVSAADEEVAACPTCGGRGAREVDGHWFSCSTCGGNGWVIESGHPVPAVTWGEYLTEWSRSVERDRLRNRIKNLVTDERFGDAETLLRRYWPDSQVAVPVSPVTVEQPAVDPQPATASTPAAVSAADRPADMVFNRPTDNCTECGGFGELYRTMHGHACRECTDGRKVEMANAAYREHLRARMQLLIFDHPNAETLLRRNWPDGVPTLKHEGHDMEQLEQILAAVRRVEAEVGAGWHPDDSTEPRSAKAIRRALDAWAGRDPGTAWFAASLIATFEQCRNADATFEDLVSQFTIEQADRLHDAAQSTSHDWHSGDNQ